MPTWAGLHAAGAIYCAPVACSSLPGLERRPAKAHARTMAPIRSAPACISKQAAGPRPEPRFEIGLFGANCSGGLAITTVPERWDGSWAANLLLARIADEAGLDFLLPIARWAGFGGASDFQRHVLETIVWATGLAAHTERIRVFATVHAAFFNPVVAAKQLATADHISGGRLGLNIVAGWNKPEFEMLGLEFRHEHAERYAYAREWVEIVKQVWTARKPFDCAGRFFNLRGVIGDPKPLAGSHLPLISAGGSADGQAFALDNVDILFTTFANADDEKPRLAALKAEGARRGGRAMRIFAPAYVVCRASDAEAQEYHRHYAVESADDTAVDRLLALSMGNAQTVPADVLAAMRTRLAGGHGGLPLIGTPETVAAQIATLADAGLDGIALSFVDYLAELPLFAAEVLPRLEEAGVRARGAQLPP
jgi:FMNH2-dependent dimethyl sulfone monooxygenase